MEAALSARDLLAELQSAILIGAQVRLEVDRARVPWDETINLTVHAFNPTGEPIEVPWEAEGGRDQRTAAHGQDTRPARGGPDARSPVDEGAEADVRQVSAMMDAGDFLVVTGPDGQPIEMRVEPIERDSEVYAAVNLRARGTPPSHPVPAGGSARLVIPAFNRGWARYPMLAAGKYTIQFSYQPQWNEPAWTKEGFGLVRSEPVTVEIVTPAPQSIRTGESPLHLEIARDGELLVATLESRWDRDLWINLNLGDDLHAQARIEWRLLGEGGGDEDGPVSWAPDSTGDAFRTELVRRIRPGERMVISRVPIATLRECASKLSKRLVEAKVQVRYASLGSAPQIREEMSERGRKVHVPAHLYSGTISSQAVPLPTQAE